MSEIIAEQTEQTEKIKPSRQKKVKSINNTESSSIGQIFPETSFVSRINPETVLFDWKSLIPSEYIDISNFWLTQNGIDPKGITKEQKEELKERAGEDNWIIKLAGFKYLAHLRGIEKVEYTMKNRAEKYVASSCSICFVESVVTDSEGKEYFFPRSCVTGVANATAENTSYPFSMFLESMAENRSFIRAVKTAFNINILGAEELQTQAPVATANLLGEDGFTTPQESLRMAVEGKGKTFSDLKVSLTKKNWEGSEDWDDFGNIPSDQCLLIIDGIISKK